MNELAGSAPWHIDRRCTNCDAARQLAPGLIVEEAGRSSVIRQPRTPAQEEAVHAAAFACPTRSIRRAGRAPDPALDPFPLVLTEHVYPPRQTPGQHTTDRPVSPPGPLVVCGSGDDLRE